MVFTEHQNEKIRKQIDGITKSITFMKFHRDSLKDSILKFIPQQATRINDYEKEIDIDFSGIPIEFTAKIMESRLDRKIHRLHNVRFQFDLVITFEIGHHISDTYNTINYVLNLICLAHPPQIVKTEISPSLKSLIKNKEKLFGNISSILMTNEQWIKEFKVKRTVDEHFSPVEFYLSFNIRKENSKACFLLLNNYDNTEIDLFLMFQYLDKLETMFNEVKLEIKKALEGKG